MKYDRQICHSPVQNQSTKKLINPGQENFEMKGLQKVNLKRDYEVRVRNPDDFDSDSTISDDEQFLMDSGQFLILTR